MRFEHVDSTQGKPPAELPLHFQGEARLQPLPSPFPDGPSIFAVHFEAGGRTRPHRHPFGQVLHVTSGQGIVGGESGRRAVGPGDIVIVMPDEWH